MTIAAAAFAVYAVADDELGFALEVGGSREFEALPGAPRRLLACVLLELLGEERVGGERRLDR